MKVQQNIFAAAISLLALSACDYNTPDYVPYEAPAEKASNETSEDPNAEPQAETPASCQESALATFSITIAVAINSQCSTCHNNNAKLQMVANADAQNRKNLLAWTGLDADKLFNHISGNPPHGGGDQRASLPLSKIQSWIAAEEACKSP